MECECPLLATLGCTDTNELRKSLGRKKIDEMLFKQYNYLCTTTKFNYCPTASELSTKLEAVVVG